MRNLKKLIAVLMVVAMLASMMVTGLAAVTYQTEAEALQTVGLLLGTGASLDLESSLTRLQGIVLAIRAMGKEADALALSDAATDAILATVEDAAAIPAWGKKYAAYAIENDITNGVGGAVTAGNIVFAPNDPLSGKQFITMVLRAMGYTGAEIWATCLEKAIAVGMLTASQAVAFGSDTALIRDDAAGILFGAVANGTTASGNLLIDDLVASGAVVLADAVDAGLMAQPTPPPATVVTVTSATATNLKEIVVVFSSAVDADTAEDEGNYTLDGDDLAGTAVLGADDKTVTITMDDALTNQTTYDLAISGIEAVNGTILVDVTVPVAVLDTTMPTIVGVQMIGNCLIKVTFSEPVTEATAEDLANYQIDDDLFAAEVTLDGKVASIDLVDTLAVGTYTLEVSDVLDFFGYKLAVNATEFTVVADTTVPTATVTSATQTELVVTFSEEVKEYGDIDCDDAAPTTNELDSDNVTLTIDFDRADAMPVEGTSVVINDVTDFSGNVADITVAVVPVPDQTRPTYVSNEMDGQDTIKVTFSEDIYLTNIALDIENFFVLKNEDGDAQVVVAAAYDVDDGDPVKTVIVLTTAADLDPGAYTLLIKNVEDNSPLANKILSKTVAVTVADETASIPVIGYSNGDDKLFVEFDEAMDEATVENLANWSIVVSAGGLNFTKQLSKDPSASATLLGDAKTVELAWDLADDDSWLGDTMASDVTDIAFVNIENLKDVAGNEMDQWALAAAFFDPIVTPEIASVEVTGEKTIKITIADDAQLLSNTVVPGDFLIYQDVTGPGVVGTGDIKMTAVKAVYNYDEDADAGSQVTITLTVSQALDPEGTRLDDNILVYTKTAPNSKNVLGEALTAVTAAAPILAVDAYAPEVDGIADMAAGDDEIVITFTEDLDGLANIAAMANQLVVKVNNVNVTATCTAVLVGDTLTITLDDTVAEDDVVKVTFSPIDPATFVDATEGNALGEFTETVTVGE